MFIGRISSTMRWMPFSRTINRKKLSESELVRDCISYLKIKGYEVLRVNSGLVVLDPQNSGRKRIIRLAKAGTSDIIACAPDGTFVAIECKTGKNKPTFHQRQFLQNIEKRGGIALIVRSVDDLISSGL